MNLTFINRQSCFFYGFWLDKSKVANYQGSLGASPPAGVRAQ